MKNSCLLLSLCRVLAVASFANPALAQDINVETYEIITGLNEAGSLRDEGGRLYFQREVDNRVELIEYDFAYEEETVLAEAFLSQWTDLHYIDQASTKIECPPPPMCAYWPALLVRYEQRVDGELQHAELRATFWDDMDPDNVHRTSFSLAEGSYPFEAYFHRLYYDCPDTNWDYPDLYYFGGSTSYQSGFFINPREISPEAWGEARYTFLWNRPPEEELDILNHDFFQLPVGSIPIAISTPGKLQWLNKSDGDSIPIWSIQPIAAHGTSEYARALVSHGSTLFEATTAGYIRYYTPRDELYLPWNKTVISDNEFVREMVPLYLNDDRLPDIIFLDGARQLVLLMSSRSPTVHWERQVLLEGPIREIAPYDGLLRAKELTGENQSKQLISSLRFHYIPGDRQSIRLVYIRAERTQPSGWVMD